MTQTKYYEHNLLCKLQSMLIRTGHQYFYSSTNISTHPPIFLLIHQYFYSSTNISTHPPIFLLIHQYFYSSTNISTHPPIFLLIQMMGGQISALSHVSCTQTHCSTGASIVEHLREKKCSWQ